MVADEHGCWLSVLRKLYRQCAGRCGANANPDGRCVLEIIFQRLFCYEDRKIWSLRLGMGLRRVPLAAAPVIYRLADAAIGSLLPGLVRGYAESTAGRLTIAPTFTIRC